MRKRLLSIIILLCILLGIPMVHIQAYDVLEKEKTQDIVDDVQVIGVDEVFEVPDIIDKFGEEKNNYIGRVKSEEKDLYSFVFKNKDGANTMRVFSHPVKYVDSCGEIKDISLEIKERANGGYITAQHEIITTFEEKLTEGISLSYNDINLTMVPDVVGEDSEKAILDDERKVVTYDADDNTSYVYELTYAGFKEDIVVNEYTGQTEYEFRIFTNGLKLNENKGSYYLINDEGEVKATIGDIIVFTADEKNNTIGKMTHKVIEENEEYILTIHLDLEYLSSDSTLYPIRIDPTIEVNYTNNGASAIEDVTINSLSTSEGTSGSLYVGNRAEYGIARVLMRFPGLNLSNIPGAYQISSATVEIRDLLCESTAMQVSCYVFTGNDWTENTASWSNVNKDSYGAYLSGKSVSYENGMTQSTEHRYSFNILTAVRGWKSNTYSKNKGIIFKTTDAIENGSTYIHKTFASYNRSDYKPSLKISYRTVSNVATMSGETYTSGTRTLTANYAYRYVFTPNSSGKYSFWTSGSTDTHISIYNNSVCSIVTGVNDDSGHGMNACLTTNLTGGNTYYILVQGYSTTTAGSYAFRMIKGIPLSGSEGSMNFMYFNSTEYKIYNNCYTYALNTWVNPITGNKFRDNGNNPGEISGDMMDLDALDDPETAKAEIETAVKNDCISWGGSDDDFYEVSENTMVPEGYYKVLLVLAPGIDYHWYRQVSDLGGKWTHKLSQNAATVYDDSGNYIYVPGEADMGIYTEVLGYYALKPPSAYATTASVEFNNDNKDVNYIVESTADNVDVDYDVMNNLEVEDFVGFVSGVSSVDDVKSVVGEEHYHFGSGFVGDVYETLDGEKVVVYYRYGLVDQIRIMREDLSYEIIVQ